MQFNLTAVLPTGECVSPSLPHFNERPLSFPQRATVVIRLCIVWPSGVPYTIKAIDSFVFTMRPQGCAGYPPGVQKTVLGSSVASPMLGIVEFEIAPADTRALCSGAYVYDVWRTDTDGVREPLVQLSALSLTPSAALP